MANPAFGMCCNHGKTRLPLLQRPPEGLMALFVANDPQAREFHNNIRQYNMALAFTSVGVTEDVRVNRRGAWVFCILGQLSHYSSALVPPDDHVPCYAQLYLYDPHEALRCRDGLSPASSVMDGRLGSDLRWNVSTNEIDSTLNG